MDRLNFRALSLCIFGIVTIAWALWINPDAYLTNDEAIYHMMSLSLLEDGNLYIWNGYEEYPTPELAFGHVRLHQGRLYPPPPILYSILTLPFVYCLEFRGLYLINAISLIITVVISFQFAKFLFRDTRLATHACVILIFATYFWEYSQAAWPHAVSVCLVTLSAYIAAKAYRSLRANLSTWLSLLSGLVVGFGVGVRLDTIFVLPVLVLPFMFATPPRFRNVLALCGGTVPILIVLAFVNGIRFGDYSPFSYGVIANPGLNIKNYLPFAMFGLIFIVATWLLSRSAVLNVIKNHPFIATFTIILLAGTGLAVFDFWTQAARLISGSYRLLVDLGVGESETLPPGASQGPGGALMYFGGVKKALLQSCPYLAVVLVSAIALPRNENRAEVSLLFLVPLSFVAIYSYFGWDGGGALNLRYFLPALPFTSILVAFAWRELTQNLHSRWIIYRNTIAAIMAFVFLTFLTFGQEYGGKFEYQLIQEIIFRAGSIIIFLTTLLCILIVIILGRTKNASLWQGIASTVLFGALVWSGLTAFEYDYLHAFAFRKARANIVASLEQIVESESIVFTNAPNNFFRLLPNKRVRIAVPSRDGFESFHNLRRFHSNQGRLTYIWVDKDMEEEIERRHLFKNLKTVEVFRPFPQGHLVQLFDPTMETNSLEQGKK